MNSRNNFRKIFSKSASFKSVQRLDDMTPTEIWELIEKLVVELKHSGNKDEWYAYQPWRVNEFSSHHLEAQIYELKKAILLPTKEKGVVFTTKVCGICMTNGHPTDMCKLLQELIVTVKVVAGYQKRNFYQKNNKGWNGNFQ